MSNELIKEFKDAFEDKRNFYFFHEGYEPDSKYGELKTYQLEWLKQHNYEFVRQDGGGEGGTERCFVVFKLDDKFFKCEYSYASYDGYYWDYFLSSMREVAPRTVEVVVYD